MDRRREYYGKKSVVLPSESSELNGRRFVGKIDVSEVSRRESETIEIASAPIPIDDPFTSQDLVDWVTTTKSGQDEIYVLKSAAGKTIRRLGEEYLHSSFGRSHQNIAIDTTRNRVYILANDTPRSSCSLIALDRNGKKLYQIKLRSGGYHLALDSETGNFWLAAQKHIGKTDLLVFDPSEIHCTNTFMTMVPRSVIHLMTSRFGWPERKRCQDRSSHRQRGRFICSTQRVLELYSLHAGS